MTRASGIGDALAEFDGDSLGDAMLDDRLRRIVTLAAADRANHYAEKAEPWNLVKDPAGKSSDLVVMICDIQARDRSVV